MKRLSREKARMLACSIVFDILLAGLCWWLLKQDPSGPTMALCGMFAFAGLLFVMIPLQAGDDLEPLARALGLELSNVFGDSRELRGDYKGFPVLVRLWGTGRLESLRFLTSVELGLPRPSPLSLYTGPDASRKAKGDEGSARIEIPGEPGAEVYGKPAGAVLNLLQRSRGFGRRRPDEPPNSYLLGYITSISISGSRLEAVFEDQSPWDAEALSGMLDLCLDMAGALDSPAAS